MSGEHAPETGVEHGADLDVEEGQAQHVGQPSEPEGTPTPDTNEDLPGTFSPDVVDLCTRAVQRFSVSEISRVEATCDILEALGTTNVTKEVFDEAAQVYFSMLDSFISQRTAAEQRGRSGAHIATGGGSAANDEEAPQSAQTDGNHRSTLGAKRRRATPEYESDDDGEQRVGKRPLDLSALPWLQDSATEPFDDALEQTRRLLLMFADDPKRWKNQIINARTCPQFPDSEWTNILAGKAINLDVVFASLHSVTLEAKHKEHVGRISIAVDDAGPAKSIRSHGEWTAAWTRASEAITFAFAHRRHELDVYGTHISQMFTSVGECYHERVLSYDRGIRGRVFSRRDLLLSDTFQFQDLYTAWISSIGAGAVDGLSRPSGSRPASKPRKRDPCRHWNDGRCPSTNSTCNYLHCCSKCRSSAHTAGACSQRA